MEITERPFRSGEAGTVLEVDGRLDPRVAVELQSRLSGALERAVGRLIVDLRKVEFLDSGSLGILIVAKREAERRKVNFALVSPQGPAKQVFSLTNTDQFFDLAASVEEAVESV